MSATTKTLTRLAALLFSVVSISNSYAQVTIGMGEAPATGALLQLKNKTQVSPDADNADKGLLLPRVELHSLDRLKMGDNEITDQGGNELQIHTGLLVYNVNNIETATNRVCEGAHVWTGAQWQPMIDYPPVDDSGVLPSGEIIVSIKKEIQSKELHTDPVSYPIGPLGIHTDKRNNDNEVNNYFIARFYAAKVKERTTTTYQKKTPYACSADSYLGDTRTEVVDNEYIEDGVWMTENLRTRFAPNAVSTPIPKRGFSAGDGDGYNIATWEYPGYGEVDPIGIPIVEGLLYNWTAATMGADGIHGKGGLDGKNNISGNGDCLTEIDMYIEKVQGICPAGWYLPSLTEFDLLKAAMIANPSYYSTDATLAEATIGKAFKHPSTDYTGTTNGTSKEAHEGGFAMYMTGGHNMTAMIPQYKKFGHLWTSNSKRVGVNDPCVDAYQYATRGEKSIAAKSQTYRYTQTAVRCVRH